MRPRIEGSLHACLTIDLERAVGQGTARSERLEGECLGKSDMLNRFDEQTDREHSLVNMGLCTPELARQIVPNQCQIVRRESA